MSTNVIATISGPLIGALIGYGTNYIAVKMLFRPLYPVKIGKHVVPFTPGIIPNGKSRIAKALGGAVGGTLVTKEDIERTLLSEKTKKSVTDSIIMSICDPKNPDISIQQMLLQYMDLEDYESMRETLLSLICNRIKAGIEKVDIASLLAEAATKAIKEKALGSMLSKLLNDSVIASIAEPIGEKVNQYIENDGEEKISVIVTEELHDLEQKPIGEIVSNISPYEDRIRPVIEKIYLDLVHNKAEMLVSQIDIAAIVEEKVDSMDVKELEELVLSVMKKELNAIVNLGALIGFLLGLLTLLF
jgi:uncharacterized membrane protein YheB (UPF0754 family)